MSDTRSIIKQINELSNQYSNGYIAFDEYKNMRSVLLSSLSNQDNKSDEMTTLKLMIDKFSGLIKRN